MVIRTDRSEAALPPSQCLHCQTILSTPGVPGSGLQPAMVTCTTFCTTCHDQYRQKMRAIDRLGTDPLKRKWGFSVDWDVVIRCHSGRKRQRQCLGGGASASYLWGHTEAATHAVSLHHVLLTANPQQHAQPTVQTVMCTVIPPSTPQSVSPNLGPS